MSGTTSKAKVNTPTGGGNTLPTNTGNSGYTKTSGKKNTKKSSGKKSSSSTSDPQKDKQLAMDTTGENFAREKAAIEKQTKKNLDDIQRQRKANDALLKQTNADIMTQVNWQPAQQKEQSAFMALRNRMGNAAYGSGIQDLVEGMRRVDDMNDAELIGTYKANMSDAYKNWFQAESDLIADYNDKASQAEYNMTDLRNRYSAALNNIKPGAGLAKNVNKASKQAAVKTKAKKALNAAEEDVLSPEQMLKRGIATKDPTITAWIKTYGKNGALNKVRQLMKNPKAFIQRDAASGDIGTRLGVSKYGVDGLANRFGGAYKKKAAAQKAYDEAVKKNKVTVG
jgi:hypothetical protein